MCKFWNIFKKGVFAENPILVLALSLCPALAVTTTVINALTMGICVTFVLSANNIVVSIIRNSVNHKVRVPIYITSIATIVTIIELLLKAYFLGIYTELGIYLQLIVVFAIILARAEVFASKNSVIPSFLDGFGMGCGFTLAMVIIATIREILGHGSILGLELFGSSFQPFLAIALPPGAFILIGYLVGLSKIFNNYLEKRNKIGVDT